MRLDMFKLLKYAWRLLLQQKVFIIQNISEKATYNKRGIL